MRSITAAFLSIAVAWPASAAEDVCTVVAKHLVEGRLATLHTASLQTPHDSPDLAAVRSQVGEQDFERRFDRQRAIERFRVDLDGDGTRDHVFLQVVGGAHCPRLSVFSGAGAGFLGGAGSELWCGWSPVYFTHDGTAHLIADDHSGNLQVARLQPGQGFRRLCDVKLEWAGDPSVDASACAGPTCAAVAAAVPKLLENAEEVGGGRTGAVDFVRDGRTWRTDSGRWIDLDNDGIDEYVRTGRGEQSQMYIELLRRSDGVYRDADPAAWAGFEQIGPSGKWLPFFAGEKLDFVAADDRVALVTVVKDRGNGAWAARHAYRLGVHVIENGEARKLGDLVTSDRPAVAVQRCQDDCRLPD